MTVGKLKWVFSLEEGRWFHYWCGPRWVGDFVTLQLIWGCALGPLEALALGGKTSFPEDKVR